MQSSYVAAKFSGGPAPASRAARDPKEQLVKEQLVTHTKEQRVTHTKWT